MPHLAAVEALGRNCHMPNALTTPLHTLLHQEWLQAQRSDGTACSSSSETQDGAFQLRPEAYVAGVCDAIRAGGCCSSRSGFAGACLAALTGVSGP